MHKKHIGIHNLCIIVWCVILLIQGAENQKRQALPLAMIQGGSLAINDKGSSLNNCTVFGNCTTQTAGANALVDPFTNNLFNGTMNHGAYQSMVHQVNSSVPLHNGTITVANKVAPLTEHDIQTMSSPHLPNTISVLKGTNIPERIKNKGTLVTIGNPSNAPIKPSRKSSFLPSNHTNVYFHVKGNAVAEEPSADEQDKKPHRVLIGPIDQLPDHNGNGPQEKKVKDLRQGSMRSDTTKIRKHNHRNKTIRAKRFTYDYDSTTDGSIGEGGGGGGGDDMALNFLLNSDYSGYKLRTNSRNLYERQMNEGERNPYEDNKLLGRSSMYSSPPESDDVLERDLLSRQRSPPGGDFERRAELSESNNFNYERNPLVSNRDTVSDEESKLVERIQGGGNSENLVERLQSLTPDLNTYENNAKKDVLYDYLLQHQNRDIDGIAKMMPPGTSMSYNRDGITDEESAVRDPYTDTAETRSLYPNTADTRNSPITSEESQYNSRNLEQVIQQQTQAISDLYKMLEQQHQEQEQSQLKLQELDQRQTLPTHIGTTQSSFYGLPEDGIVDRPDTADQSNEMEYQQPAEERFGNFPTQLVNNMRSRLENEEQQNGYNRYFDRSGEGDRRADEEDANARNFNSPDPQEISNRELLLKLISMYQQRAPLVAPPMQSSIPQHAYVPLMQPVQDYGPPSTLGNSRSLMPQATMRGSFSQPNSASSSKSSIDDILLAFLKSQNQQPTTSNFFQNAPTGATSPGLQNAQGVAMLMVQSLPDDRADTPDNMKEKKEKVEYKKNSPEDERKTGNVNKMDEDSDFSRTLKRAADYVLGNAVKEGNISLLQRAEIEKKLGRLLDTQFQNKTKGEVRAQTRAEIPRVFNGPCIDQMKDCGAFRSGGVCPFMKAFMKGSCRKTCDDCSAMDTSIDMDDAQMNEILKSSRAINLPGTVKSNTPTKPEPKIEKNVPDDPVMYLTFESSDNQGTVKDTSGKKNNAKLSKGATVSQRVLGTCGKVGELNEGSITWNGTKFKRKPESAISISMWVKVKKSGVINWFANGKKGVKRFYTKTKGAAVPPKVWTHVAGTYDTANGLARIYVNGEIEEEQQQKKGGKLEKNWLVNGVGSSFGDDSLRYVDELLIYDRALSSSEVRTLFNRCVFNRMVLHYGFQKGNASNLIDQSGLHNDAKLIGGAVLKQDCGKCGACLDLTNGPEPTLELKPLLARNLPRSKITIAVWVNLNSTEKVHNIFTAESSHQNIDYRLQVFEGRIRWAIGSDKIPQVFDKMTSGVVVPEGLWTHIIVSYNNQNGVGKIYANGILKEKFSVPEKYRIELPTDWDNDASIGDATFRGYMDEFLMYNWQLDDSEAIYVRDYCADKPKLVRFTVRVPLTKKTIVPKPQNWWNTYSKLWNKKKERAKKATIMKLKELTLNPENAVTLLKHRK